MQLPESLKSLRIRFAEIKKRIPAKQLIWLITAATLLCTFSIGMTAIQGPWQEKRRRLDKQILEERQRLGLLSSILQLEKAIQKKSKGIFFSGGTPALTARISRLAVESGVKIDSVLPQPDRSFGRYVNHQIQVVATSSFQNLLSFLHTLEVHKPLFRVDSLDIVQPGQGSQMRSVVNALPGFLPKFKAAREQRVTLRISVFDRKEESP